jgi:single-stranded-DNA-specific exonuclease
VTSFHIGFILGPRINACGRISEGDLGVRLLLSKDRAEAQGIARLLDEQNRERQAIEREIFSHAVERIEKEIDLKDEPIIVLSHRDWHPGVIGIVASRILEKFSRPVILISLRGEIGRGSGRSFGGFHLFQSLEKLKSRLISFGGHRYAAGLNILEHEINDFRRDINRLAKEFLSGDSFIHVLEVDSEVSFRNIGKQLMEELELLQPYGQSNPKPLFISSGVELIEKPRLVGGKHLKFFLKGDGRLISGIAFGLAERKDLDFLERPGTKIDLAYVPEENEYMGIKSIELKIKDCQPTPL